MPIDHQKVVAFVDELLELYAKYEFTLAHEDGHGAFLLEGYDRHNIDWLKGSLCYDDSVKACKQQEKNS